MRTCFGIWLGSFRRIIERQDELCDLTWLDLDRIKFVRQFSVRAHRRPGYGIGLAVVRCVFVKKHDCVHGRGRDFFEGDGRVLPSRTLSHQRETPGAAAGGAGCEVESISEDAVKGLVSNNRT